MLTIKHIGPDGRETIVECDRFVRERRADGNVQFTAQLDGFTALNCASDYAASWCGREYLSAMGSTSMSIVYVMNRHGKTVETYRFDEPDFSASQQGGFLSGDMAAAAMAQADRAFVKA